MGICIYIHKVVGLLLPSVAQLVLPQETSIPALSYGEAQSVILLLFQHFMEVFVKARVLWNPHVVLAVLTDDISLWLSAAFCIPRVGHLIWHQTNLSHRWPCQ